MNANRRSQERKLPEQIVLCKLGGEKSSSVLNLSEDGLCFESLTPIEETGLLHVRLSADLNSPIEATGRLAWIDPAKRTGGLSFLELSAPARQQIRAWLRLSENSAAVEETVARPCRSVTKQADDRAVPDKPAPDMPTPDKPGAWQETRVPSLQLVPVERHRAQKRRLFLLGVLLGFGIGSAVIILTFRYAGGTKLGSLPWTTASANRAAQSSAQQTQASVVQPAPAKSPQSQNKKQSPPSAAASSTNLMTRASPAPPRNDDHTPQLAKPGERVASSRPGTKAEPLGVTQAAAASAPAASNAHSSSGQVEGPVERPEKGKVQHPKKASPTPQQLWAALQAGNVKAAVALADLYARGEGVPVNCQQARILLQIASEKKNAEASRKLQELDKGGCPASSAPE